MKTSWWDNIPHYAKYDEMLDDRSDDYLIAPVLSDDCTAIERSGRDEYILFGEQEALLYRPVHLITRLGMDLYCTMLGIIRR